MLLSTVTQRRRAAPPATAWSRFNEWRRRRPFIGGLLVAVSGIEMFFSSQLDLGHIKVQLGIEGFQATVIPIALVLLGVLALLMPAHHVFYGVLALVVAVYSLIGVNLGGFVLGMLLGCVGGVLVVAWMPRAARAGGGADAGGDNADAGGSADAGGDSANGDGADAGGDNADAGGSDGTAVSARRHSTGADA